MTRAGLTPKQKAEKELEKLRMEAKKLARKLGIDSIQAANAIDTSHYADAETNARRTVRSAKRLESAVKTMRRSIARMR